MALLIKDEDVASLAPMHEVVDAMEAGIRQYAEGDGASYPRRIHMHGKTAAKDATYKFGAQLGMVSQFDIMAVRLNSGRGPLVGGRRGEPRGAHTAGHGGRNWSVLVLFDMKTGELVSIFPQFTLSGIRVGATTAVGVKHLSRPDSSVVGIFGSSKIARAELEAISTVRKLKRAKVFSPNQAHREEFARDMSKLLGIQVEAAKTPKDVVQGSDIVCVSTSSNSPVFDGDWLEPGQLVTTTKSSPRPRKLLSRSAQIRYAEPETIYRTEIDRKTLVRSDMISILNEEMVLNEDQRELLDPIEAGLISWDKIRELGEIVAGNCPGRSRPEDLIVYASTGGMGFQMAAAGWVVYKNALAKKVGLEVSGDWFSADTSDWHKRGYFPTH
jgi:alanine dehydrogenase